MKKISLDGLMMNAVESDENGVINQNTIFRFRQEGQKVYAEYQGGRVDQGYLVGIRTASGLQFRYCQLESDGSLNGGLSNCEIVSGPNNKIQIIEKFQWHSRPGGGRNVIQEM